uniref:Uncharacterized protein n=1 Tax=Arundo donax TaxID=35708 RepID=A0A0A9AJ71_ARUDO
MGVFMSRPPIKSVHWLLSSSEIVVQSNQMPMTTR